MKKAILALTSASLIFSSIQSKAANCDLEKSTIQSLNSELNSIESQLSWSRSNRNTTTANTIGSLYFLAAFFSGSRSVETKAVLTVGAAATALNGYNIYLTQKEVSFYQDLAKSVRQKIEDKEAEMRLGLCISDKVQKSKNEKAKELFDTLIKVNKTLNLEVKALESQLGNFGEKASTVVSVGATVLLIAGGSALKFSKEGGAFAGAMLFYAGAAVNAGSQVLNLPSLHMSSSEARQLLEKVKIAQAQLSAQEDVLRAILN